MEETLHVELITIRPVTQQDKRKIFEWLTNSNLTREMIGPPDYPDSEIPTWEEFITDYPEHYFTGTSPLQGRCFIILDKDNEVGQINYNTINTIKKVTDLDIWLRDKKYTGKGIGPQAIKLLCDYLYKKYYCEQIRISPSKRNKNAIRAYEKAGFIMTDIELEESEKDYRDNVVLIKQMKNVNH